LKVFIQYAEFKRIFDNIERLLKINNIKCLSCLSYQAEEGRSLICSTIAIGLTEMLGYKVLIVDAGNPTSNWNILDIFENKNSEFQEQEGLVHNLSPNLDGLQLSRITIVAQKAQEYRIQDIILEYKNKYDLILFDTAALNSSNRGNFDPWVIAARTDASIIITSNKTSEMQQQFMTEPILKSKVIGIIENSWNL
jgi:Mrp family chromosome partitioning ATPase